MRRAPRSPRWGFEEDVQTLFVTMDSLIFEPEKVEPGVDLQLQFKAISGMPT